MHNFSSTAGDTSIQEFEVLIELAPKKERDEKKTENYSIADHNRLIAIERSSVFFFLLLVVFALVSSSQLWSYA